MHQGFVDGMCLAAVIAEDRHGLAAAPGLAPRVARALSDALSAHEGRRDARREAVSAWAAGLGRVDPDADLPPRARALLAGAVPRAVGQRWLSEAAPVRRGFRAPAGLLATLRRLGQPGASDAAAQERAAAAELDHEARARWTPHAQRLHEGELDRVVGALALGARGDLAGDARSRLWRRVGAALAEAREASWPA